MMAIGIDLGGTKIETQLFDQNWQLVASNRVPTPTVYDELVVALAEQVAWGDAQAGSPAPVGVGAAGLINKKTGLALTANICATGKPLPADLVRICGREITYINDCRALALSESVFGASQGYSTALALILGTGIGGGVTVDGQLLSGATLTGGEFGHISAPAFVLAKHNLLPVSCGCGATGCMETYISGLGMSRIAEQVVGQSLSPPVIATQRHSDAACAKVWKIWCEIVSDFLRTLTLTIDPDIIVLAGGLSNIDGLIQDLNTGAKSAQLGDSGVAPIVLAQGGDSSGARGAAYAAYRASQMHDVDGVHG